MLDFKTKTATDFGDWQALENLTRFSLLLLALHDDRPFSRALGNIDIDFFTREPSTAGFIVK